MSETLVRDSIRFTKGSVIHIAGKTFTAEELRDGLDNLIHPPCPCAVEPPAPEPVAAAEPEPEPPKKKTTKTPKRKTSGTVEHL